MNVLLWLPTRVGDSVHSIPFLRALKQLSPGATVDVIARGNLSELAELYPGIDHIYIFTKEEYGGLAGKYRFGRMLAARKQYDLYFTHSESFTSALVGFFSGAKVRVGRSKEFRSFLLTHALRQEEYEHNVDDFMGLLEAVWPAVGTIEPDFSLTLAPALLQQVQLPPGKNMVLCLYGSTSSRHIPHDRAVDLIRFLLREYDYNLLIIGTAGDRLRLEPVLAELGPADRLFDYTGRTSIQELTALIAQADFMVSVDSGPAHLANCLGRKLVVLFGQGDERIIGPYASELARPIRVPDLPCAPCHKKVCPLGDVRCLTRLDNTMVGQAIQSLNG